MVEIIDDPTKVAQTDSPATESTGWMNSNGEFGEGVPETVKTLIDAKKWTNVEQMATGYSELEKFKGIGEHLVIPESVDDVEGWKKIHSQLGVPESANDYKINKEELVAKTGIEISDELMQGFKEFGHSINLTDNQLPAIVGWQLEAVQASNEIFVQKQTERREENITAMKQKWGSEYESTVTRMDSIAEKLGVLNFFQEMGIDKEPEIVNALVTLSNSDSEDSLKGSSTSVVITKTPTERLDEIKKDEAFNQRFHPKHKEIMAEYMDLCQSGANAGQGQAPRT